VREGAAHCDPGGVLAADGEFGNGSTTSDSTVPVAVDTSGMLAGKTITQISAATQSAKRPNG
jgi:hypothetical protein